MLPYPRFKVQPGKKYLFHVISAAAFSAFRFSIDGHRLRVVAVDLTPIEPTIVNMMSINVGQRVTFLLEPDMVQITGNQNFWIRATMETACYAYTNPALDPNVKAILEYSAAAGEPSSPGSPGQLSQECRLLDYMSLKPLVKKNVPVFRPGIDHVMVLDFNFKNNAQGVNVAYINNNTYVASTTPVLDSMIRYPTLRYPNGTKVLAPTQNAFVLPDKPFKYWAFLIINNYDNGEHPWHKHNSNSHILGEGRDGPFDWAKMKNRLNYKNPLRRDTWTVPYGAGKSPAGWAVVAWPVEDAGTWALHCVGCAKRKNDEALLTHALVICPAYRMAHGSGSLCTVCAASKGSRSCEQKLAGWLEQLPEVGNRSLFVDIGRSLEPRIELCFKFHYISMNSYTICGIEERIIKPSTRWRDSINSPFYHVRFIN